VFEGHGCQEPSTIKAMVRRKTALAFIKISTASKITVGFSDDPTDKGDLEAEMDEYILFSGLTSTFCVPVSVIANIAVILGAFQTNRESIRSQKTA